jgi:lipid-A-disaccharide synthase
VIAVAQAISADGGNVMIDRRRQTPSRTTGTLFFSVGEPSGDLHAANLIRALRHDMPGVNFAGLGGPRMRAAGCDVVCDLTQLAVMWVGRVLAQLPRFRRILRQVDRQFEESPPSAVVLIDYPGFNWHVARRAKAHGIPVIYYGVPQLWAWAPWRVRKMRRLVDHALCKLPFEQSWFRARGVRAEYVGHPYFDELTNRPLDLDFMKNWHDPGRPLITLLPGSRRQEVQAHAPWLIDTMSIIRQGRPACRFAFACFNDDQAELIRGMMWQPDIAADVFSKRTPELIELATCTIACSGSVSLELLYHRKPSVIVYRVGAMGFLLQDMLRTARYITLGNLLAADSIKRRPFGRLANDEQDRLPFPEYVATRNCSRQLASHVNRWLDHPRMLQQKSRQLDELCRKFVQTGASERAASRIREILEAGPAPS